MWLKRAQIPTQFKPDPSANCARRPLQSESCESALRPGGPAVPSGRPDRTATRFDIIRLRLRLNRSLATLRTESSFAIRIRTMLILVVARPDRDHRSSRRCPSTRSGNPPYEAGRFRGPVAPDQTSCGAMISFRLKAVLQAVEFSKPVCQLAGRRNSVARIQSQACANNNF